MLLFLFRCMVLLKGISEEGVVLALLSNVNTVDQHLACGSVKLVAGGDVM